MDNYKAENQEQEQEIDLVSLFFAVAHRYKQMVAAAVICAVLFGGFGVVKGMLNQRAIDEAIANGEEVPRTSAEQQYEEDMVEYREAQTKHDTDVTSYKQQLNQNEADQVRAQFDIDNAQEYIDKSVRQKLDPYNVYTSETRFYITTDYKIMPGMDYQNPDYTSAVLSAYNSLLTSHESIITIADQFSMEERYMRELISVSVDNATRLLTITTYGEDADEASRIMDLMLKRMEVVRENIETTVLTWLRDSQQNTRDNMTGLQNNLTDLQNKHELLEKSIETADQDLAAQEKPEEPKQSSGVKKFVLIGFLLGIVAVAGVAVVRFLMEDKVCVSEDLQSSCGVGVLGTLANAASKSAKGMDASLNKMEKRPDGSADAEMTRLIAATIRNRVPEAENILLTGDIAGDQLTALGEALEASGELDGKNILVSGSILQSSATVSEAAKVDVVVLAADCAVSTHASLRAQKAKLESFGKKVLGCVLYA
mgnify:CR=1 FL=1